MSSVIFSTVLILLWAALDLLGRWQRAIDEKQRAAIDRADGASRHDGNIAIAQHPQIDVQACIGCGSCVQACPEAGVLAIVGGVARVVRASKCIGHGRCADACPVGAIEIGLGDTSKRADIPLLSDQLETSVGGIYIAGELGGYALIRVAIEQGTRAISEITHGLWIDDESEAADSPSPIDPYDVLIVGSGPAGIAASLEATRRGLRYLVIDQDDFGGTVRKYPRRKLTLTGPMRLPLRGEVPKTEFLKEELLEFWEQLREQYRLNIRTGVKLIDIDGQRDDFVVETSSGVVFARRILLCLGRRGTPRKLGVPGESSEQVLYQLIDAASYENQRLLVVGGGDSAIEAAMALAEQHDNDVTISYRKAGFVRLCARNEDRIAQYQEDGRIRVLFESEVRQIEDDRVVLEVRGEPVEIANDFVFVCAGGDPPFALLQHFGIAFGGDDASEPARDFADLEAVS